MPVNTIAGFAEAVRQHRLLEPAQLREFTGTLQARFREPRALAGELIRRGWLTPYQINQLFLGRGDDLLLESYVLRERLGEGGMGEVFKAKNWKLNKIVAVKIIRKGRLADTDAVRRFQREVRAAAQLDHPNVVHAIDCGECGDRLFFVMEYVEGTDLARLVKQHGPFSVARACDCARQTALGLQHAFERGLVHRDIKPHNLLLETATSTRSGRTGHALVKILDMGLARVSGSGDGGDSSNTMTREGTVMGTLDYIAPEQALNAHTADTRADLYSLGCTLYFLLTGQVPFPGSAATEKLLKHQLEQPTPVERLRPDVPAPVAAILRKLMAKNPEDRYQTPADAAAALVDVLSEPGIRIPVAMPAAMTQQPVPVAAPAGALDDTAADWSSIVTPSDPPESDGSSVRRRAARRRWFWFSVAGVIVLLGLLVLLVILLRGQG